MSGLGKCHCGKDAVALYPLLPGSPAFCHTHDLPDTGPDDFDIPFYDPFEDWLERGQFNRLRAKFIWTTKAGEKIPLQQLADDHLQNCINLLKKRLAELPPFDTNPEGEMVSTEQQSDHLEAVIELFEKEQKERKRGSVKRVLPSFE
jgi:hypothetical protein